MIASRGAPAHDPRSPRTCSNPRSPPAYSVHLSKHQASDLPAIARSSARSSPTNILSDSFRTHADAPIATSAFSIVFSAAAPVGAHAVRPIRHCAYFPSVGQPMPNRAHSATMIRTRSVDHPHCGAAPIRPEADAEPLLRLSAPQRQPRDDHRPARLPTGNPEIAAHHRGPPTRSASALAEGWIHHLCGGVPECYSPALTSECLWYPSSGRTPKGWGLEPAITTCRSPWFCDPGDRPSQGCLSSLSRRQVGACIHMSLPMLSVVASRHARSRRMLRTLVAAIILVTGGCDVPRDERVTTIGSTDTSGQIDSTPRSSERPAPSSDTTPTPARAGGSKSPHVRARTSDGGEPR